jgi:hypothetical protein
MREERKEEPGKEPVWIERVLALYRRVKDFGREE